MYAGWMFISVLLTCCLSLSTVQADSGALCWCSSHHPHHCGRHCGLLFLRPLPEQKDAETGRSTKTSQTRDKK